MAANKGVQSREVQESVEFNGEEVMGLNIITPGDNVGKR